MSTSVKNGQGYTVTIPAPAAGVQNAPIVAPTEGTYGTGDSSKYNPVITGQGPSGNNQPVTKVVQQKTPDWSTMTDEQIEAALKGMAQSMTDSRGTAGYDDALRSGNAELKRRQEAAKKQAQQDALDKAVKKDKENQEMVKKTTEGLSSLWNRIRNNLVGDYNNDGVVDAKDIAEKFKQDTSKPVIDDTKPGTLTPEIVNPTNNGQNVTTRTQLDNEVKNGSNDPFVNPVGFYEEHKNDPDFHQDPQPEQTSQPDNTSYRGPTNVQPPKEEEQPKEEETETPWQYTGNTGGSVFRGNPYTIGSGSYFNDDNTVNTNTQSWFDSKDYSYFDEPPAKQNDGLDYKRQDLWNAQNTAPQNDSATDSMTPPPDYTGITTTQNTGYTEGGPNVERPDNSSKTELEQAQDRGDQYRQWSNQINKLMREAQQSQKLAEAQAKSSAKANLAAPTTSSSTVANVPQSPADKQAEMIRKAQQAAAEASARASVQSSRIQAQNLAHFSK